MKNDCHIFLIDSSKILYVKSYFPWHFIPESRVGNTDLNNGHSDK